MPAKRHVVEQAVTTLATVADNAEERFMQYYDTFMPVLIEMMGKANGKDLRLLRGKTVECISMIGLAVGKEKFLKDAKTVMDILLQSQRIPPLFLLFPFFPKKTSTNFYVLILH